MTPDGVTSAPTTPTPPVLGICGHQTTAPVPVGEIPRASGGGWHTHYVCPDCVHLYGPLAQWDELPALRWTTRR
ncbi:hypothetical protein [Streptomyces sp. NPDC059063]|uniref:hypothetical protein n=1 Tax=unclassified Streptomyces TaxID=2593676 RepID=UPI00369C7611